MYIYIYRFLYTSVSRSLSLSIYIYIYIYIVIEFSSLVFGLLTDDIGTPRPRLEPQTNAYTIFISINAIFKTLDTCNIQYIISINAPALDKYKTQYMQYTIFISINAPALDKCNIHIIKVIRNTSLQN